MPHLCNARVVSSVPLPRNTLLPKTTSQASSTRSSFLSAASAEILSSFPCSRKMPCETDSPDHRCLKTAFVYCPDKETRSDSPKLPTVRRPPLHNPVLSGRASARPGFPNPCEASLPHKEGGT